MEKQRQQCGMGLKPWAQRGMCHCWEQAKQSRLTLRTQEGLTTLTQEGRVNTEEKHTPQLTRYTHGLSQTGHVKSLDLSSIYVLQILQDSEETLPFYSSVKPADLQVGKVWCPGHWGLPSSQHLLQTLYLLSCARLPPKAFLTSMPLAHLFTIGTRWFMFAESITLSAGNALPLTQTENSRKLLAI